MCLSGMASNNDRALPARAITSITRAHCIYNTCNNFDHAGFLCNITQQYYVVARLLRYSVMCSYITYVHCFKYIKYCFDLYMQKRLLIHSQCTMIA